MVKLGFVVEGDCEAILLNSQSFRNFAKKKFDIHVCHDVINVFGGGNLCSHNLRPYIDECYEQSETPDKIVILTDLECDVCILATQKRIGVGLADSIIIARKALEAWFLADHQGLSQFLGIAFPSVEFPEQTLGMPWIHLRECIQGLGGRGIGTNKKAFTKKFVSNESYFSLERAAQHPHCPSAQYFLTALQRLAR